MQVAIEVALDEAGQATAKAGCADASDEGLQMREQHAVKHTALRLSAMPTRRAVVASQEHAKP